ncbi:MAG: leucine-rich repeat protein [Oscillospiraceae bacterium]
MKQAVQKTLCCLCACLQICAFAPSALAADTAASGTCGDGITWTLENGVLTISGSGRMTASSGWKNLRNSITSIVIEEGITSICTSALDGCAAATSVSLPSTLTNIGANAFCNCSGLTELELPEGLLTIGGNSFSGCSSLTSITLPGTLTALADSAFGRCKSLTSVTLSEGLVELSQSAFMGCDSLTSITLPSTVTKIGAGVFFNSTKLVSVYFMGDAPKEVMPAALNTLPNNNPSFADRVTLYYKADANGWTSPTWNGYKTALWNDSDSPFLDVSDSAYYYDAVLWAVENKITSGTQAESAPGAGDGLFSPNNTCTRGEVVTFLWRTHGKPEPVSAYNPFSDVTEGDYFYDAVLWAVEQGITAGTKDESYFGAGDGLFSPGNTCSRAEVLTFLWRANGKPETAAVSTLADGYAETDYFKAAVAWANTNGLLVYNIAFSPADGCSRADVVTYLYLDAAKYSAGTV